MIGRCVFLLLAVVAAWCAFQFTASSPGRLPVVSGERPLDSQSKGAEVACNGIASQRQPVLAHVPLSRPARRLTSVAGRLIGGWAPGFGDAWVVEAYRLTGDLTAVVESARVFVTPGGEFLLSNPSPGEWQLALVEPHFAWGPRIEVRGGESITDVELAWHRGTGALLLDHSRRATAPARVGVFGLRSPELARRPVAIGVPIASRTVPAGAMCSIEGLDAGEYELRIRRGGEERVERRSVRVDSRCTRVRIEAESD